METVQDLIRVPEFLTRMIPDLMDLGPKLMRFGLRCMKPDPNVISPCWNLMRMGQEFMKMGPDRMKKNLEVIKPRLNLMRTDPDPMKN